MKQRLIEQYAPLIGQFLYDIKGLDVTGIPAPHIPIMGQNYEAAKYKIAFIGMETYGWTDLSAFKEIALEENGLQKLVTYEEKSINSLMYLNWAGNCTTTFWGFPLRFLSKFYNVELKELMDRKHPEILTSFVWGETNSIERYGVSTANNVNYNVWEAVKKASICFDSANNLIKAVAPKIFFVLHSGVDKDYISSDDAVREMGVPIENRKSILSLDVEIDLKIRYHYLRGEDVHIIALPHPRWMGQYSGHSIDFYVDKVIDLLNRFQIWDSLPKSASDWKGEVVQYNKSSIQFKRKIIAELAAVLMRNNLKMSGKELQLLLNMNQIQTQYGTDYGESGGRGVHKLIASVWQYYYNRKDFQTAYNISRAFVNQNGEQAW